MLGFLEGPFLAGSQIKLNHAVDRQAVLPRIKVRVHSGNSLGSAAGIFQGGGTVNLQLTQNARPGDVIAVTVEPAGGTKAPTTAPIAAHTV